MEYVLKNKRTYEGTQIVDLVFKDNVKAKTKFQKCVQLTHFIECETNNTTSFGIEINGSFVVLGCQCMT